MKRLWYIILQVLLFPRTGECQNTLNRHGRHERVCPYNDSLVTLTNNDVIHVVLRGDGWGPFDDFQHAAVCISAATVIVLGQCNSNVKRGAKRLGFLLIQRYFDANSLLDPANLKIWDSFRRISDAQSSREKDMIYALENTFKNTVFDTVRKEDYSAYLKKNSQDWTDQPKSGVGRDVYSWIFRFRRIIPNLDVAVWPFNTLDEYFKDVLNNAPTSERMRYEWVRYETFKSFPLDSPVMPSRLAKSGFYYSNCDDEVTCYSCQKSHRGWQTGDIPSDVHVKISPSCQHAIGVALSNVPIHSDDRNNSIQTSLEIDGAYRRNLADQSSGVRTKSDTSVHDGACAVSSERSAGTHKHPDMTDLSRRLDTFDNLNEAGNFDIQKIANCGYYYSDSGRCLRCFSCGTGVRPLDASVSVLWDSHNGSCILLMQRGCKEQHLKEKKSESPPLSPSSKKNDDQRNMISGYSHLYGPSGHMGQAITTVGYALTDTVDWRPDVQNGGLGEDMSRKNTTNNSSSQIDELTARMMEMGFRDDQIQHAMNILQTNDRNITIEAIAEILLEDTACPQQKEESNTPDDKINSKMKTNTIQKRMVKVSQKAREECARMRQQLACKICLDQEACMVIIPCGHLTSCTTCTLKLRKCPICRKLIKRTIKASM